MVEAAVEKPRGIELFHQDGNPAGVWYCSKCRIVHKTQAFADSCCGERLCECGKPIESHRKYSGDCQECDGRKWREKMAKQELDRFEKATKIQESEWIGDQVFVEPDHYFETVDEAVEYVEGHADAKCEYVWATKNVGIPKASIEDLIDRVVENMWEDADTSDLYGVEDLEAAIDGFNKANEKTPMWMPDYSTAILVSQKVQD